MTPEDFQRVKHWQQTVMGNTCTICHGNNVWTRCEACGFWGYVVPEGYTVPVRSSEHDDHDQTQHG
jgi:hypothetical protein